MSRWPIIFGVTGILTAAFGLLGAGCDMMTSPGMVASMVPSSATADLPSPPAWSRLVDTADTGLAALLLVTSIGLLRRRAWAVRAAVVWSWAKSITAIGSTLSETMTFRRSIPSLQGLLPAGAMEPGTVNVLLVGFACICLVLYLSTPLFVLFWFRRPKIRAEVAGWATPSSAAVR